jgi:hypothetical protein
MLRRVLIRDQADRGAIASDLLRYRTSGATTPQNQDRREPP